MRGLRDAQPDLAVVTSAPTRDSALQHADSALPTRDSAVASSALSNRYPRC